MYTHRVEDVMSAPPIVIAPTTSIEEAQRLMDQRGVRHLAVVRDDCLVGILTRGDLRAAQPLHAALSNYEWRALLGQVNVTECMTSEPLTITPDTPALIAAEQMVAHKIASLPVVQGEQVVGMVTETDLLRLLVADEARLAELKDGMTLCAAWRSDLVFKSGEIED